jgi:hypothetical protein
MNENDVMMSGGGAVTADHAQLRADGQQKGYIVLSPAERAKGFVRPVRRSYKHVGPPAAEFPLRDLTAEEAKRYEIYGYVKYEPYPESRAPIMGRYYTQAQLDAIDRGCGEVTRMPDDIAETYARNPKFYGSTFCIGCGVHHPVIEFTWIDDDTRVGS